LLEEHVDDDEHREQDDGTSIALAVLRTTAAEQAVGSP
jgi:hypothetical protein